MKKVPYITRDKAEEISRTWPTPFYLYDEKGIRENAEAVRKAFSWNPGFREYFAVKATPNPYIMQIFNDYDFGFDCSSMAELMLADSVGADGAHIMFSSNDTPAEEYAFAAKLGAIINLDDITHIPFLENILGGKFPETMSLRYNPGGVFRMSNGILQIRIYQTAALRGRSDPEREGREALRHPRFPREQHCDQRVLSYACGAAVRTGGGDPPHIRRPHRVRQSVRRRRRGVLSLRYPQ